MFRMIRSDIYTSDAAAVLRFFIDIDYIYYITNGELCQHAAQYFIYYVDSFEELLRRIMSKPF
jgi:hypothetical protein